LGCQSSLLFKFIFLLLTLRFWIRILVCSLLSIKEFFVFLKCVSFQIFHILINTYCLRCVLFYLTHEILYCFSKFWVFFFYYWFITLKLLLNMIEEGLKMKLVIHNKFINDSFMKFNTGELIWVALNNDRSQIGKVFRDCNSTVFHNENVFVLDFLQKLHICFNVFQ